MLEDSDRLLQTIEQVLRAGRIGARRGVLAPVRGRPAATWSASASRWRARVITSRRRRCAYRERLGSRSRRRCSAMPTS